MGIILFFGRGFNFFFFCPIRQITSVQLPRCVPPRYIAIMHTYILKTKQKTIALAFFPPKVQKFGCFHVTNKNIISSHFEIYIFYRYMFNRSISFYLRCVLKSLLQFFVEHMEYPPNYCTQDTGKLNKVQYTPNGQLWS